MRALARGAQEDIDSIESEKARRYIGSLPHKPPIPPERIYPNANPEAIHLLQVPAHSAARRLSRARARRHRELTVCHALPCWPQQMLVFSPTKRITVEDALAHPYLASLHDPSDEPLAHAEFSFDFERLPLNKQVLRELVLNEMLAFHPEIAAGGGSSAAVDATPTDLVHDGEVPPVRGGPPHEADGEPMQFD